MARGYPDYFGTSIWPKYGTPIYTNVPVLVVPSLSTVDMITISGSGVLFSSQIELLAANVFGGSTLSLLIDGAVMSLVWLDPTYMETSLGGGLPILGAVSYSKVDRYWKWVLSREVPFRTSAVLRLFNASFANITVVASSSHYVVV